MRRTSKLLLKAGLVAGGVAVARAWARQRREIELRGRSVVVAGGSRGLGLAIAREVAREGAFVALLARSAGELEAARRDLERTARASALPIACDVTDPRAVHEAFEEIRARHGRIDVLFNVAGIIQVGPQDHMRREDFERALAVHLWGPFHTMREALPEMRRQGFGRIVNIASIGGRVAVPHLLPYTVSKFALVGLSDGIRAELAKEGVRVTTVTPGLMRTGSHFNVEVRGRHEKELAWFAISDGLPGLSMDARRAAKKIVRACRYGDPHLTVGMPARLAIALNALFPGFFGDTMALVNRILPAAQPGPGDEPRTGWESRSRLAPSIFTRLVDRAAEENNELRGRSPAELEPLIR